MSRKNIIAEDYGPLSGIRVLGSGTAVAMPSALTIMGDLGAEIIHLERPGHGDVTTRTLDNIWHQEARNRLSFTLELDLAIPEIKEVFFGLIKEVDVFIENQVWLDKFGIYDEELLEINPELVIVHISGYGREEFGGAEGYTGRASYDMIGQAFSGYLSLNGTKDRPIPVKPYTNDFMSALWATVGALSALRHAQKTGEGQVVDISQYESMARALVGEATAAGISGKNPQRSVGNDFIQPFELYRGCCGDWVAIAAASPGVFNRFLEATGFDKEEWKFNEVGMGEGVVLEKGRAFAHEIEEWCLERTAVEIEDIMAEHKVPCSKVNTMLDILEHPHFEARENFVEYEDHMTGRTLKSFGVIPKMSETPGKIWRGSPSVGQDTNEILEKLLDYDEAKISELKDKGYI